MSAAINLAIRAAERDWLPDTVIRWGIRRLLRSRLDEIRAHDCETMSQQMQAFVDAMNVSPIAPLPQKANEQHYEVPAEFFSQVLGPHHKYSSCYFTSENESLNRAEENALAATCQRAGLEDGMRILELGCGWGSLTLWMASHYPEADIVAVSNSASQRRHITGELARLGHSNVRVVTADMNDFDIDEQFDRVVSVEMFEHMRNYASVFERIHGWLVPKGRFFMHIFCHRTAPYEFADAGDDDWMSRYFFSGGIMPSDCLPLRFQSHLKIVDQWRWSGTHYERTANAWLANMDYHRETLMPVLANTYGAENATLWWTRWRTFFMACAELFGHDDGQEWWVSHYLFERREL